MSTIINLKPIGEPFMGFAVYDEDMDRVSCHETHDEAEEFAKRFPEWNPVVLSEEVVWVQSEFRRGRTEIHSPRYLVSVSSPAGQRAINAQPDAQNDP